MKDEIVTLKVTTEGDQAALQSLTKLDQLIAKINGQKVNISFSQGMKEAAEAAQKSAEAIQANITAQKNAAQEQSKIIQQNMEQMDGLTREQLRSELIWQRIAGTSLRSITQNIREATDELKAMNAEMVSIQKVTGATDADMERLKDSAFEVAGALGAKPSEYLASVTKWAQAGYGALSDQLGELSAKTQVVGDVNEETANKFLLAVDAAYKYKGNIDALTRVLDGANEISNNYATSVEKLAGGMGIVSSLAEQAGMKVEETMAAIGTITAKTQESGNSAARALRALILNIQGSTEIEIDAETGERWTEDEIQRTAAALGKLNVATREYKNGIMELRNPMKVIGELAEKYQKGLVTEAQLQDVVSSLGGKVRSNQLMALIQGYETYTSMIETYKDALGSADNELQIYLNGWEAKSKTLTAQWAEFIESFKATDISIGILDFGNDLLELANSNEWTTLAAHILTLTAAFTGLNMVLTGTGMAKAVSAFFTNIITSAASASGAMDTFGAVVNASIGWVGLAAVAITALVGAIDAATVSAEEQRQKTADAVAAYEQEKATLEGLEDQLKTTRERIDELNGKGPLLTVVEQEELDKLEEENRRLERQIILQKDLAEAKKRAAEAETNKSLNKGYTGANYNYQPWRDNATGTPSITKGNIEYELGRRSGFEGQANYLMGLLDQLEEKKKQFLADNGDQKGWTTQTASKILKRLRRKSRPRRTFRLGFTTSWTA